MDAKKQQLLQTVMSFPAGSGDGFFVAGQMKVFPPVEKGGGCPGIVAANPLHAWAVQR